MTSPSPYFTCPKIRTLNFTTLLANSADNKLMIFCLIFPRKQDMTFHAKLFPLETICMKRQILFPGKGKKNISKCRLLKILPRVLSVKLHLRVSENCWMSSKQYHPRPWPNAAFYGVYTVSHGYLFQYLGLTRYIVLRLYAIHKRGIQRNTCIFLISP